MTRNRDRIAHRGRSLLVVLVALLTLATCFGPSAGAGGNHRAPVPSMPPTDPGFRAAPTPLMLKAERVGFISLSSLTTNSPIQLSNGAMSPPDTIYVRAKRIELDGLTIGIDRGSFKIAINNNGAGTETAAAGDGPDAVVEMWIQINALQVCVTAQLFQQMAMSYAGVFGGSLDEVLQMITDAFAPAVAGPLATVGPCVPAGPLVPLVGFSSSTVCRFPTGSWRPERPTSRSWAVKVYNSPDTSSFLLPRAFLGVEQ